MYSVRLLERFVLSTLISRTCQLLPDSKSAYLSILKQLRIDVQVGGCHSGWQLNKALEYWFKRLSMTAFTVPAAGSRLIKQQ